MFEPDMFWPCKLLQWLIDINLSMSPEGKVILNNAMKNHLWTQKSAQMQHQKNFSSNNDYHHRDKLLLYLLESPPIINMCAQTHTPAWQCHWLGNSTSHLAVSLPLFQVAWFAIDLCFIYRLLWLCLASSRTHQGTHSLLCFRGGFQSLQTNLGWSVLVTDFQAWCEWCALTFETVNDLRPGYLKNHFLPSVFSSELQGSSEACSRSYNTQKAHFSSDQG